MNKQILLVCLLTGGALGCFGSDSEMNSQCLPGPCPWEAGAEQAPPARAPAPARAAPAGAAATRTAPIVGSPLATFDSGDGGFMLDDYDEPRREPERRQQRHGRQGTHADRSTCADGSPGPGSLKVVAPYLGRNQYVDVQKSFGTAQPQNWTGGTLHVRIRVSEGTFTRRRAGLRDHDRQLTSSAARTSTSCPEQQLAGVHGRRQHPDDAGDPGLRLRPVEGHLVRRAAQHGQLRARRATPVTFNIDSFSMISAGSPARPGRPGAGGGGATGGAGTSGAGGSGDASVGN